MRFTCPCGKIFDAPLCRIGRKKYCSKKCFYKYRTRPSGLTYKIVAENKSWFSKGHLPWNTGTARPYYDRTIGYLKISHEGKEVKYHRFVMERYLGRKLTPAEVVHHINGDVFDNRIENLSLFNSLSDHMRHHWKERKKCQNIRKPSCARARADS